MKPSKIKKVGRCLYIYFKIPFFSNYEKMTEELGKYYDDACSIAPYIDKTGKYFVIGFFLRSREDVEPYINGGNNK